MAIYISLLGIESATLVSLVGRQSRLVEIRCVLIPRRAHLFLLVQGLVFVFGALICVGETSDRVLILIIYHDFL